MYIHAGGEAAVSDKYIIGIFDFDGTTPQSSDTIEFLKHTEKRGHLESVSSELPRSFIVTLDRVYMTPLSPVTLMKRLEWPGKADKGRNRIMKMTWDMENEGGDNCIGR